jgi:hypothetical protein
MTKMITLDFTGTNKFIARIDKKINNLPGQAKAAGRELAEALIADVRDKWSETSPSAPGMAPAIDTGNLDSSGKVEQRGSGGRFGSAGADTLWAVRWSTLEGNDNLNRGEYAQALEYGNDRGMLARPFLRPGIQRMNDFALDIMGKKLLDG